MTILVTGSAGHLGEACMRVLRDRGEAVAGLDLRASAYTDHVGDIADPAVVTRAMQGVDAVIHTATLHKPQVASQPRQAFVDTNVTGTLNLLEAAAANKVRAFVFTSTTSTFGDALVPPPGAPAAWITEDVTPVAKNIYGATKTAAEDLCRLFHRNQGLACLVLRTSRFFPEPDDTAAVRDAFDDTNVKANEFLYRRVDVSDIVDAHLLALARAPDIGFGRYIISATTPFTPEDLAGLRSDAPAVVARHVPEFQAAYQRLGWRMFPSVDRVYVNARARQDLGWQPTYDFRAVVRQAAAGGPIGSDLARAIGIKGYPGSTYGEGLFPEG